MASLLEGELRKVDVTRLTWRSALQRSHKNYAPISPYRQQILEIEKASAATSLMMSSIVALTALFASCLRRKAKAASRYQSRAAILAQIREQTDRESPIVG